MAKWSIDGLNLLRLPFDLKSFHLISFQNIDSCSRSRSGAGAGVPDLWSEPSVFGDRAEFIDYGGSQPAVLAISDVSKFHDEGKLTISMTSMKYASEGPFFIIHVKCNISSKKKLMRQETILGFYIIDFASIQDASDRLVDYKSPKVLENYVYHCPKL